MQNAGILLSTLGSVGVLWQCVRFVVKTLPENYGGNPGFGCLEVKVAPWLALTCLGLGLLLRSWGWGIGIFIAGVPATGFLAILLGRIFGRKIT